MRLLALVLLAGSLLIASCAAAPPKLDRLSARPEGLVDHRGRPVTLRGVNLGNWLMLEMWMLGWGEQIKDQQAFFAQLDARFGPERAAQIIDAYRDAYIGPRDFDIIAAHSMNVVRVPFDYGVLMDDDGAWREGGFRRLDDAIAQAEHRGLYTILDLHGAPGRQSAMDHSGARDVNELWSSPRRRAQTVALWRELARRYRGRSAVAAYDLINEPWGGKREELRDLVRELYTAVRAIDQETIIVIPGYYDGIDFYGTPAQEGWSNVVYTMHFYPGMFGNGEPTLARLEDFLAKEVPEWRARMARFGAPLLVGEFNVVHESAGGGAMTARLFDAFAQAGWPATLWTYKVYTTEGGQGARRWGMVTNRDPLPALDLATASFEECLAWARSQATVEYAVHEELRAALTNGAAAR